MARPIGDGGGKSQAKVGKHRPPGRRAFLKGAGLAALVVTGGGVWRALHEGVFSTGQGPAYEPWENWRSDEGKDPLPLVRAAVLAASPHNTQPWRFHIAESHIDLHADRGRNIGTIDPFLREMYIGLGCALENLVLASAAAGYLAEVVLLHDAANPAHAARIDLRSGKTSASDLYRAIPDRHTNRGPYDMARPVAAETLRAMQALGDDLPDVAVLWYTSAAERRSVGALIIEATEAIIADAEQSRDSGRWLRLNWESVQRYRDGLTLDALGGSWLLRAAGKMLPPLSREQVDQFWLDATKDVHVPTATAFGMLVARDPHDNNARMRAGRLWQRMHLWGTIQGLGLHPLSQPAERADRESHRGLTPRFSRGLQDLIGDPSWHGLMPFRLGYPRRAALRSPRRSVTDVIF